MGIETTHITESIEQLSATLVTLFCEATETAVDTLKSEPVETALSTMVDVSSSLLGAISYIRLLQKVASIPTKLFMVKLERYISGVAKIPESKRQKYLKKVGKPGLNKDSILILNLLNKVDELSKIEILLALFEAKLDERIDDTLYRRLTIMVDRTMFSDLIFLGKEIKEGDFKIRCEEEALISTGFIMFSGIAMGTFTEDGEKEGGNIYHYTDVAKAFCQIVFGSDIPSVDEQYDISPPRAMTEEEVDKMCKKVFR